VIPVSTIGGAFYIKDAASVSSARNEIKYCHLADIGQPFILKTLFSLTARLPRNLLRMLPLKEALSIARAAL